tara:strand:+ start:197 stop:1471 length:1275 start_codon:yes stop_codon:yes gene_type:complete
MKENTILQKNNNRNDKKVITFGCRLNSFESAIIKNAINDFENTLVINTCAVTAEAERQARQHIRRIHRENPNARIFVTGCSAQVKPHEWASMKEVNGVIGNREKFNTDSYSPGKEKIQVNDIMSVSEISGHLLGLFNERSRAFLQIQNGCDHRCTFCIIPFARGNSVSVSKKDILRNAQKLFEKGFSEIVLTGVDIGDYGKDLGKGYNLADLIESLLNHLPNLNRLRISSIDPSEIDEKLIFLIQNQPRLMPYFHLSVQSGDDMILKRMKRRHSVQDVKEVCRKIIKVRPESIFGADFIAGFPTETEEMFLNTINLVKECNITMLHVFPYSVRQGTPAAKMPQIPINIIKDRAKVLRELGASMRKKMFKKYIGKSVEVLIENESCGYTKNFIKVNFDKIQTSKITTFVKILSSNSEGLIGLANE